MIARARLQRDQDAAALRRELWKTSGHWDKYRENMFVTEAEDRPMAPQADELPGALPAFYAMSSTPTATCRSATPSPASLHRNEPSGTLHGLLRVRHFTQDDAHIFCTEEQIEDEVHRLPGVRLRDATTLFGFDVAARALDPARAADRHRRDVGPRRGARSTRRSSASGLRVRRSTRATARSTARRSTST